MNMNMTNVDTTAAAAAAATTTTATAVITTEPLANENDHGHDASSKGTPHRQSTSTSTSRNSNRSSSSHRNDNWSKSHMHVPGDEYQVALRQITNLPTILKTRMDKKKKEEEEEEKDKVRREVDGMDIHIQLENDGNEHKKDEGDNIDNIDKINNNNDNIDNKNTKSSPTNHHHYHTLANSIRDSILSTLNDEVQVEAMDPMSYRQRYIQCDTPMRKFMKASSSLSDNDDNNDDDDIDDDFLIMDESGYEEDQEDESTCTCSMDMDIGEKEYDESLSSSSSSSSESDVDEEDLLNQKLFQDVKELRQRVRDQVIRTAKVREETIQQCLHHAVVQELELYRNIDVDLQRAVENEVEVAAAAANNNDDDDRNNNNNDDKDGPTSSSASAAADTTAAIQQMISSLNKLETTMGSIQQDLPQTLTELRDTMNTISHSIHKENDATKKNGQDGGQIMGTERAIQLRFRDKTSSVNNNDNEKRYDDDGIGGKDSSPSSASDSGSNEGSVGGNPSKGEMAESLPLAQMNNPSGQLARFCFLNER